MITVIRLETTEEDRKAIRLAMGKKGGSASRKEVQTFVTNAYEKALHGDVHQEDSEDDEDEEAKPAKKSVLKKKTKR